MKLILSWIKGLLFYRPARILGSAAGVALTIALLAGLGAFFVSSSSILTKRAISDVPVDW